MTHHKAIRHPLAVRGDFDYYFVAPEHYFDMPKVAAFRSWLEECVRAFPPPETEPPACGIAEYSAEKW